MKRFHVTRDTTQWLPLWNWTWVDRHGAYHGAYPFRWVAWLAGFFHTL